MFQTFPPCQKFSHIFYLKNSTEGSVFVRTLPSVFSCHVALFLQGFLPGRKKRGCAPVFLLPLLRAFSARLCRPWSSAPHLAAFFEKKAGEKLPPLRGISSPAGKSGAAPLFSSFLFCGPFRAAFSGRGAPLHTWRPFLKKGRRKTSAASRSPSLTN